MSWLTSTRPNVDDVCEKRAKKSRSFGRWVMETEENILSSEEADTLFKKGAEAAKGYELEIPDYPEDKLREFILGCVGGAIWTDHMLHLKGESLMLGQVFMPLLFGGISPKDEAEEALQGLLHEAEEPEEPEEPELPEVDQAHAERLQSQMEWGYEPQDALENYHASILSEGLQLQAEYAETHRKWRAAYRVWERKMAEDDAVKKGFMTQYSSGVGCVWEYDSKAIPGRAINRYPIFLSCRLMNKNDFQRALRAMQQVGDNLANMDLRGGETTE